MSSFVGWMLGATILAQVGPPHSVGYEGFVTGSTRGGVRAVKKEELLFSHQAMLLPEARLATGTKIRILTAHSRAACVRVLIGPMKGQTFWLTWDHIK